MGEITKNAFLTDLISRYSVLSVCSDSIMRAYLIIRDSYKQGGKLLIVGNGGSAAHAEHIVGELMKGFVLPREIDKALASEILKISPELGPTLSSSLQMALPAIALDGHPSLSTAYMNDCDPQLCFAQQINGYGTAGDVFLGISTSGNSRNILYAAAVARAKKMKVIGLTGERLSGLSEASDVCIRVPEQETYKIQELHLPVYHCLCLMLEDYFFGEGKCGCERR